MKSMIREIQRISFITFPGAVNGRHLLFTLASSETCFEMNWTVCSFKINPFSIIGSTVQKKHGSFLGLASTRLIVFMISIEGQSHSDNIFVFVVDSDL